MPFEQTPHGAWVPFPHGSQQSAVCAQPAVNNGTQSGFSQYPVMSGSVWWQTSPGAHTGTLSRTLRTTNAIENLNSLVGRYLRNVRRWRDGHMLVRWIAAGLHESGQRFRRIRGHADLPALIRALDRRALDTRKEVA